jgi:hypothetical protein
MKCLFNFVCYSISFWQMTNHVITLAMDYKNGDAENRTE